MSEETTEPVVAGDLKERIVILALKKMFEPNGSFSICTLKDCIRALGIYPPQEIMDTLDPLHCVKWTEMDDGTRHEVAKLVLEVLHYPSMPLDICGRFNLPYRDPSHIKKLKDPKSEI